MKEAMKILLAVDGSDCSTAAVDEAARIPWPGKSELRILSVAEMPSPVMAGPMPMPGTYYVEWEKALEDQAEANNAKALARYYERGGTQIEVTAKSIKGNTKEVILDEAASWGADLLLIGTHGYNTFERMWLGSVSRTVASHAKCSVEIVRQMEGRENKGGMKLLLAVDGSPFSDGAVAEVADRPWPAGTEVKIITAIHLPFTPTPETWVLPDDYYSEAEKTGREQAETVLRLAQETILASNGLRPSPLSVSSEAILGHAEEVILSVAREWGADMILLGSHGYRAWERFLLGSVSQAVAWHAHCSVEIVRLKA